MRPPRFAAEYPGVRAACIHTASRFNEAAAIRGGIQPDRAVRRYMLTASMRPPRFAAEYQQIAGRCAGKSFSFNEAAAIRGGIPIHAECLGHPVCVLQ